MSALGRLPKSEANQRRSRLHPRPKRRGFTRLAIHFELHNQQFLDFQRLHPLMA